MADWTVEEELLDDDDSPESEDSGQGLAEYALILAFVALVCVTALGALGSTLAASPAWTLP